ncbi:MAG: UvrD-helicase domain-containing protein [Rhabdochlamydiaceae bacterium]|nr:UvrD-helicase domain-containing protein [Candidatus Amphrikana amoebophyrae]
MTKQTIRLNQEQKLAVESTEGRVLVLAGAGSGKTSVLISRMIHLVQNKGVDPSAILGLTFTNKAAGEMRQRIKRYIPSKIANQIHLCTFHSFCFHLLKAEIHHLGYTNKFSIYDDRDMKRVVSSLLKHHCTEEEVPAANDEIMSNIKKLQQGKKLDTSEKLLDNVAGELPTVLRAYNAVDFDGLIELTLQLFQQFPDILAKYQQKYRYIMIDEYQDTNPTQYEIAALISKRHNNLCVVGDDDQSIYGWRGAEVKHILQFEYDHLIKLEQNYRSTPIILDAANNVISNNSERHEKTMWCDKTQAESIHIFHAPDEEKEAEGVITRINDLRKSHGLKWGEMAILYRSNSMARQFEMALMKAPWKDDNGEYKRGIPYKIAEGSEFYSRAEIKDVLAYLKSIENPNDQEALLRIINYPRRGISTRTVDILTQYNRQNKISLWNLLKKVAVGEVSFELVNEKAVKSVALFVNLMEEARKDFYSKPLHEALTHLLDTINFMQTIADELKSEKAIEFRHNNVNQLIALLKEYNEGDNEATLHDFVHNSILDGKPDRKNDKTNLAELNLLTFHSSKGLEFRACFIIGAEDHLMPHEKSVSETGVEEERRLMYVAMTRAKEFLTISMTRSRNRYGKPVPSNPSRFLFEIPKEWLKTTNWDFPSPYDPYQPFVR